MQDVRGHNKLLQLTRRRGDKKRVSLTLHKLPGPSWPLTSSLRGPSSLNSQARTARYPARARPDSDWRHTNFCRRRSQSCIYPSEEQVGRTGPAVQKASRQLLSHARLDVSARQKVATRKSFE